MNVNNVDLKKVFLNKKKILDEAKKILKQEFVGIDKIIDEVIDNVSSWFFFSDLQEKPVVINLWGLTGVGKTSLVSRLVELIDMKDSYYRLDLGNKSSFTWDDLCENEGTSPLIITLDEIQHSRTVSGPFRQETGDDENRIMWEIIDSGKIQYTQHNGTYQIENLNDYSISRLK